MATHLAKRLIQGIGAYSGGSPGTFAAGTIAWKNPDGTAFAPGAGYVSPNLQGLDYSHKGKVDKILNQAANTGALVITDEYIELSFDYIPQGTSDATARAAAAVPPLGSSATITNLPIIQIGTFADALNAANWIYEGDGGGSGKIGSPNWDGKISLRRYVDITTPTAILAI
jgi:hypothetical protein